MNISDDDERKKIQKQERSEDMKLRKFLEYYQLLDNKLNTVRFQDLKELEKTNERYKNNYEGVDVINEFIEILVANYGFKRASVCGMLRSRFSKYYI